LRRVSSGCGARPAGSMGAQKGSPPHSMDASQNSLDGVSRTSGPGDGYGLAALHLPPNSLHDARSAFEKRDGAFGLAPMGGAVENRARVQPKVVTQIAPKPSAAPLGPIRNALRADRNITA